MLESVDLFLVQSFSMYLLNTYSGPGTTLIVRLQSAKKKIDRHRSPHPGGAFIPSAQWAGCSCSLLLLISATLFPPFLLPVLLCSLLCSSWYLYFLKIWHWWFLQHRFWDFLGKFCNLEERTPLLLSEILLGLNLSSIMSWVALGIFWVSSSFIAKWEECLSCSSLSRTCVVLRISWVFIKIQILNLNPD